MARLELKNGGVLVGYLNGGMKYELVRESYYNDEGNLIPTEYREDVDATLAYARERLPSVQFDSVSLYSSPTDKN